MPLRRRRLFIRVFVFCKASLARNLLCIEILFGFNEGIIAAAQLDSNRRAFKFQRLTERLLEVARVISRHLICLFAMNDDDGRILPTGVRISKLNTATVNNRWRVINHCILQYLRKHISGELLARRVIGAMN